MVPVNVLINRSMYQIVQKDEIAQYAISGIQATKVNEREPTNFPNDEGKGYLFLYKQLYANFNMDV